ncbi:hypothetical protein OCU04_008462 [Sclerotinia nivalis]|uniref:Uncharacterized protein n=1 Tax=Sclerotinia nivalis TaxID=352851 RepID=A0A9X0DIU5_9HELO|nr:hypothetical protein OCU04_008462 [Sclerotinia nivalis]
MSPDVGLEMGLEIASARVVTAFGGILDLKWMLKVGVLDNVPKKTCGAFERAGKRRVLGGGRSDPFDITI